MMKKLLAVVLILTLVFSFAACGDSSSTDKATADTAKKQEEPKATDAGDIDDYYCAIKGSKIVKDYEGKDAIQITYEFKNNSEEAADFLTSLSATCYQDGVELEEAYFLEEDVEDKSMSSIKPGATLDVVQTYVLQNATSDVEVEVTDWLGLSDTTLTKIFKLAE